MGSVPSDRMLPTEAYDVFEWISIIVFTAEYLLHIAAAPKAKLIWVTVSCHALAEANSAFCQN